jgi:MFS family permease
VKLSDTTHLGLLFAASFLMDLVMRAGAQAYQEGGIAFRATPLELGLLGTFSAFCYSLTCPFAGAASDRFGRRRSTCIAGLGLAAAFLLASQAGSIHQLMALTVLSGTSAAFFWPAAQAWIADLGGRGRRALGRNLGLFNVIWSTGLMVGPVVTGYLWASGRGSGRSQAIAFSTVAGLAVALTGLMFAIRRTGTAQPEATEDDETPHPHNRIHLRAAWVGVFAGWFAGGVITSLFPKLGEHLGYDERMRGLLCSAYHLGQLAMFAATRASLRWHYRRWPMAMAELLGGAALASVLLARGPAFFAVAFFLTGLAASVPYSASLFYSLHGRTENQGLRTGLHEAILASGVVLGPLLGGFLAQTVSLRAPFAMAGVVYAGAVGVQWWIWGQRGRETPAVTTPPPPPPLSARE